MEFYVAVPKSIIDIYWNGIPEKSEALGMFLVKPEIKKGLLGRQSVIGFNEAITGEKIVNHVPYGTEYSVEYVDEDCMIEGEKQIGDLAWEIIDKSTAERILSPEELERYMSLTPEDIREQLSTIREKARILGQKYRNFELAGSYKRRNIGYNDIYVARPKGIIDIYWNGLPEKSEALGMFLVKPEIKKGLLGRQSVIGFSEVITGEKIVNRVPYGTEYGVEYVDEDCMIEGEKQIGDLAWEIIDKSTAERILSSEELERYMSLTPEEICKQLATIREKEKQLGQESGAEIRKK